LKKKLTRFSVVVAQTNFSTLEDDKQTLYGGRKLDMVVLELVIA
jgi:hypothetical protein